MSRLKIKGDNGWFAAAAGWQAALEKLSDGAFKLFVHISLGAERSTGRFLFRQQDLARALRKSRRSIGTYLQELEERQVCRVRRSSNQHAPGVLEIADQYWPYQRSLSADSLSSTRSAQTLYVEAIGEMLLECPCIRCRYSTSDRRAGCLVVPARHRTRGRPPVYFPGLRTQVRLLAQRTPGAAQSVPCITSVPFYRRSRAASFLPAIGLSIKCKCCDWKKRWLETDPDCDQKGGTCLGKLFPSTTAENQEKRDDVDPKNGGITLVIDSDFCSVTVGTPG